MQCQTSALGKLEVLSVGDPHVLFRPCVDCGLRTGRFCDGCLAAVRVPTEVWAQGHMTPFCSHCETKRPFCHFCEGKAWATPPVWLRAGHTSHHEDENEAAESEATEGWTVIPEAEAQ